MTTLRTYGDRPFTIAVSGETYVETGLDQGNSMSGAVSFNDPPFKRIVGIEINPQSAAHVRDRFSGDGRVEIHEGSTVDLLPKVIDPGSRTVFWLDAHSCGDRPETYSRRDGPCPLLTELKIILGFDWKSRPTILIDDAMVFCSHAEWRRRHSWPGFRPQDYPTFGEIFDAVGGVDEKFNVAILKGDDPGGIICCF
jgi:hypothetical protein